MKKEQNLLYTYEDGTTEKVCLDIKWYQNGNLCIRIMSEENGYPESLMKLTVNGGKVLPDYFAYLDTNNVRNAVNFVIKNGLGELVIGREFPRIIQRGFCVYPLYKFSASVLHSLCPEQAEEYEHRND